MAQSLGHSAAGSCRAREPFGSCLRAKGRYRRRSLAIFLALELLLAHPNDESPTLPASLYAEGQRTSPGQPVGRQMGLDVFTEVRRRQYLPPRCRLLLRLVNEIDPETHYTLGVAYKNMGLLDEAKGRILSSR